MAYLALKPCRMAGVDYISGDTIPREAVIPEREAALIDMGLITKMDDPAPAESKPEPAKKPAAKKAAAAKSKAGGGAK